ncbi:MAG: hypothetical protein KGL39_39540 [Patescibacteria group bacterium]|nr:hypothetical protein [Patescibacteria group bacterium]
MANPITIIPTILKYASKLWGYPLRFYYTKERLDPLLILDISASGDRVNYQYCTQEAYCWLQAYNLSPFDFTIDRIKVEVQLNYGGCFTCENNLPITIDGASKKQFFVKSKSPMTSESFERVKKSETACVNLEAQIITSIRPFAINRSISDVKNFRLLG